MRNFKISSGNLAFGIYSNSKIKDSSKVMFTSTEKDETNLKQDKQLKTDEKINKEKKWTGRKVVDVFTVTAYAAIVSTAIAIKKCRPATMKNVEKLANNKKAGRILKDEITLKGQIMQGKYAQGGPLYRVFDYFGKLKNNSAELTNNLVYGFGTLVIMPLVILFSPIGKKDASKEDRTFTVLRQPISFATVFAVQLTFEKVFKSLINDLNKYRLLDGIKSKGNELFFSEDRMNEALQEILKKDKNGNIRNNFYFNSACLADKKKFAKELEVLKEHLEGNKKEFIDGELRTPIEIPAKGNKFTLEEFSDSIVSVIKKIGEQKPKPEQIDNLKKLVSHYIDEIPDFATKLENMAYSGSRCRANKETLVIIANSIISQALGIMMLNLVYGKMMKKYTQLKQQKTESPDAAKGGAK